jgi:phage terminase large subunit-like protein
VICNPSDWGAGQYRPDVPICKLVKCARARQVRDLERSIAGDPSFPYYFDEAAADDAVWFISQLRHFDSPWTGQPFILTDWQEWDIIRPLFGWKCRNGTRRFHEAYIELPRKDGKSALGSAIAALGWMGDNEFGAQVYSAATKEEQARIVWTQARRMVELSPTLKPYMESFKSSLYCPRLGSTFRPLGRDSRTQDGLSVHLGILDEYHAHKTDEMYQVLATGMGARRNSLLVIITTAGTNPAGPCKQESDRAKRLLQGHVENDTRFAYVTTVDDVEKWDDETEWKKANPNFGITIVPDIFRDSFNRARQSRLNENAFKTKNLNIWTSQTIRWIQMEKWDSSDGLFDLKRLKGKRCYAGLDLGLTNDVTALVLAYMDDADPNNKEKERDVFLLCRFWVPEASMDVRYREDGVIYPQWAADGHIQVIPGETTRTDYIRKDLNDLSEQFEISEVAIDRWNAAELSQQLSDDGFQVVKHAQSMSAMNYPCRSFEDLILQRRLKANCNPVLRWMVSNAAIARDGNENIKVVKDKSGDRVDGVVAACMAIGRLLIAPEPFRSVYRERGIRVL